MRSPIFVTLLVLAAGSFLLGLFWSFFHFVGGLLLLLVLLGIRDVRQRRHAVLRNFPVIGHFRYLLELIRPEINQYFIESDLSGVPFSREERSLVYQRAKQQLDTVPADEDVEMLGSLGVASSRVSVGASAEALAALVTGGASAS